VTHVSGSGSQRKENPGQLSLRNWKSVKKRAREGNLIYFFLSKGLSGKALGGKKRKPYREVIAL